jgi:hypothetical protein
VTRSLLRPPPGIATRWDLGFSAPRLRVQLDLGDLLAGEGSCPSEQINARPRLRTQAPVSQGLSQYGP